MIARNRGGAVDDRDTDLYAVLGVSPSAPPSVIRGAYKALAKELHPDVAQDDPDAAAKFRQITQAYEVLCDHTLRARYDIERAGPERVSLRTAKSLRPWGGLTIAGVLIVALAVGAWAVIDRKQGNGASFSSGVSPARAAAATAADLPTSAPRSTPVADATCNSTYGFVGVRKALVASNVTEFETCTDPARGSVGLKHEAVVLTTQSTGLPEASDATYADLISGPCRVFTLHYAFSAQGDNHDLDPFQATPGTITSEDDPGQPVEAPAPVDARPDQVVFFHNSSEGAVSAQCG